MQMIAFLNSFRMEGKRLVSLEEKSVEPLAQIIADFIRKSLLLNDERFSFETVFSHRSKLDIMRKAREAGYKVYLYFISTESPRINIDRVKIRVRQNGHNVPEDLIVSRYYRSLDLLYEAAQLAYQAYFFDNSEGKPRLIAHFKLVEGKKEWDNIQPGNIPVWFRKYYSEKVEQNKQ